jgi:hypothetical protein
VLELEVLVVELATVNTLTARAIVAGEIAALEHELGDNAVEAGALVVQGYAGLADALLAGAQRAEVFDGLGDGFGIELQGSEETTSTEIFGTSCAVLLARREPQLQHH